MYLIWKILRKYNLQTQEKIVDPEETCIFEINHSVAKKKNRNTQINMTFFNDFSIWENK